MAVIDASSEKTKWFLNGEDKGGPRAKFAKKRMRVFFVGREGGQEPHGYCAGYWKHVPCIQRSRLLGKGGFSVVYSSTLAGSSVGGGIFQ